MGDERFVMAMPDMKRVSTTARVQEAIRESIIVNNLKPGDPLPPEGEIAIQLGVSRTSVREAIRSLQALGMVEVRHGHGVFVKGFDFDALMDSLSYSLAVKGSQIQELLEVREGLEVAFVPAVVTNIPESGITELEGIIARMRQRAARGEAFPEEDREFHLSLYQWAGNDLLLRLIKIFWMAIRRLQAAMNEHAREWDVNPIATSEDHAAILDALKAGDTALVRERIRAHYRPMKEQLSKADVPPGEAPSVQAAP